jgi:hypothetical protein
MDIAECLVRHARSQITRTSRQVFCELDLLAQKAQGPD